MTPPTTTKCTSLYTYFIICFKLYFTRCLSFLSGILILVNSTKQQQEQKYKITVLDLDVFSVPKKKNAPGLQAHENMSIRCNCSPRETLFKQVKKNPSWTQGFVAATNLLMTSSVCYSQTRYLRFSIWNMTEKDNQTKLKLWNNYIINVCRHLQDG